MNEILNSSLVKFEPRARLLKLLGAELIRDDVMAIVELVKNAHDADASTINLTFNGTRSDGGEILVEDDGEGMGLEVFRTGWMQPAGSRKRLKEFHYTGSGRRVLGEKGVGRFAVDRLGGQVQLTSRGRDETTELVADFDWDEFDDGDRPLSDVQSTLTERTPQRFINQTGTLLRIRRLRSRWTERNFRKLSSRLKRLISPFGNGRDFSIRITSDEFPDYSASMDTSFLDSAPHRISAEFDGKNTIHFRPADGDRYSVPWAGPGELECGPVKVTLNCFDLERESISRIGPGVDVKAWLREWSGVSMYRDDYRVLPYGEPDDDWLRLDQRRVNNPVVRLSNNQVCGFVEITGDGNSELRDQTNRGGLMQNKAFDDLRALVLYVFREVEDARQDVRNPKELADDRNGKVSDLGIFASEQLLNLIKIDDNLEPEVQSALEPKLKAIEEGVREAEYRVNRTLDTYLDLASIGQTASYMGHALEPRIRALKGELEVMLKKTSGFDGLELGGTPYLIMNIIDELENAVDNIPRYSSNRAMSKTRIDLIREISQFEMSTSHLLSTHDVQMSVDNSTAGTIRALMRPEPFAQVLHALLWNSLYWMEGAAKKMIRIKIDRKDRDTCRVIFQDNGPGISDDISDDIFEPGFTTKDGNRGMGLTVARSLLRREGGDISLMRDRRRARWTSFEITLKNKKPKVF
jgi:signal transduction histidine kinase